MSLPSEPTRHPQRKEMGNGSPAERSEPLLSSQESHLRPNRRAPDGESSTIHPTGWLSALKARALPLAVLSLALNLILISVIIILSTLSTRPAGDRQMSHPVTLASPADPVAACPDGWVGYLGKCYYFSEAEANWTDSQKNCSALGASLSGIDTQQEMEFLMRYKGHLDYWIGLHKEPSQAWKWANGTKFNNWFPITGEEHCAVLSRKNVASSGCWSSQPWICSKSAQKSEGGAKGL